MLDGYASSPRNSKYGGQMLKTWTPCTSRYIIIQDRCPTLKTMDILHLKESIYQTPSYLTYVFIFKFEHASSSEVSSNAVKSEIGHRAARED